MNSPSKNRNDFIRHLPFFKDLHNDHFIEISKEIISQRFSSGKVVSWAGEPCKGIYFIRSGWLKVTKTSENGRELTLNLLKKGDSFNLISIFSDHLNPATVIILEDAELYFINSDSFYRIVLSSPGMCLALMKQMADRVKLLTDLAGHLTLNSVESRIARWLLDESVEGSIQRKKWLTQNEMASIVGTVPDVTSRILRNFVEEGLIRFDRREIKITDRNSLAEKVRNLS